MKIQHIRKICKGGHDNGQECMIEQLFLCANCGLFEGSLTTECPQTESYSERADAVYTGKIDYRDGKWIELISIHSPKSIILSIILGV